MSKTLDDFAHDDVCDCNVKKRKECFKKLYADPRNSAKTFIEITVGAGIPKQRLMQMMMVAKRETNPMYNANFPSTLWGNQKEYHEIFLNQHFMEVEKLLKD